VTPPVTARTTLAPPPSLETLDYDTRARGDTIETSAASATKHIHELNQGIQAYLASSVHHAAADDDDASLVTLPPPDVAVSFNMSSTSTAPSVFSSTLPREISFGAHHGLHHLAMLRIIAEGPVGKIQDLPSDFGKAPSTNLFERADDQ
jgi:hypothetical protein